MAQGRKKPRGKTRTLGGFHGVGRSVNLVRGEGDINRVGDGLLGSRGVSTLHMNGPAKHFKFTWRTG
eukprot:4152026-Pyramimonas_sp.AAC.2